jgi:hypothetical protein
VEVLCEVCGAPATKMFFGVCIDICDNPVCSVIVEEGFTNPENKIKLEENEEPDV